MLIYDQHPHNKSIMIGVLGRPNVGKSSLINYLLGFDLSAVTHKAQTTRNSFHCNLTIDHTEIILVDTPGFHKSNQEINKRMNQEVSEGGQGADLNFLLIDLTQKIDDQFEQFCDRFEGKNLGEIWMVFTKSDLDEVKKGSYQEIYNRYKEKFPQLSHSFIISAKSGEGIHKLTGAICDHALPGPHLYTNGEVSNKNERFFVTEYIREQAFKILRDELPYELAVVIDKYEDFGDKRRSNDKGDILAHISASILVNRTSQRAIVVGTKGTNIREIGVRARKKIEAMVGGKIYLNLHVKVSPKWFKNNAILEELGLSRAHNSTRVWRKK